MYCNVLNIYYGFKDGKMNWKSALFAVFTFVFVTIFAMAQMASNLSFDIITLPQ
jgi:hypothetical protein